MKELIFLVLVALPGVASADPFSNFIGSYAQDGAPTGTAQGYSSCWDFKDIDSLVIKKGFFHISADLQYTLNGTPAHSRTSFTKYNYTWNGYTKIASIAGDSGTAVYVQVEGASGESEFSTWTISESGDHYHLKLEHRSERDGTVEGSCTYDVDLLKK